MSRIALTALAIRLTGIFLGLSTVKQLASLLYVFTGNYDLFASAILFGFTLISFIIALIMIFFPVAVAEQLNRGIKDGESISFAGADIEALACSLVGLYFLIEAILSATYRFTLWQQNYPFDTSPETFASLFRVLAQFLVAAWLLFGANGIARALRWARTATVTTEK